MLNKDLEILFEDDAMVAVNKPSGLLVHRTNIAADVNDFAMQRVRDQVGQRVFLVHRLDRPTSGVLLFGKTKEAAVALSIQFEEKTIQKSYLAIVRGYSEAEGHVDYALKKELTGIEQDAITDYATLDTTEIPHAVGRYETARYSLVRVVPQTGRMHQIRRHFKHLRHPIIGDRPYGDRYHNRFFREHFDLDKMLLHAQHVGLQHPLTNQPLRIEAPLPSYFAKIMKELSLGSSEA